MVEFLNAVQQDAFIGTVSTIDSESREAIGPGDKVVLMARLEGEIGFDEIIVTVVSVDEELDVCNGSVLSTEDGALGIEGEIISFHRDHVFDVLRRCDSMHRFVDSLWAIGVPKALRPTR